MLNYLLMNEQYEASRHICIAEAIFDTSEHRRAESCSNWIFCVTFYILSTLTEQHFVISIYFFSISLYNRTKSIIEAIIQQCSLCSPLKMYTWTKNHDGEIVEWISSGNGAV